MPYQSDVHRIRFLQQQPSVNPAMAHFDWDAFDELDPEDQQHVLDIVRLGIDHPDSGLGVLINHPDDYQHYAAFLDPVIRDYHRMEDDATIQTVHSWEDKDWQLRAIDPELEDASIRIRVARNVEGVPMVKTMTRDDRLAFEATMQEAFERLEARFGYRGHYYSLTEGSPNAMSPEMYQSLREKGLVFQDMSEHKRFSQTGLAEDWPDGRGIYVADDERFVIWVNEEDHLRIASLSREALISEIFKTVHEVSEDLRYVLESDYLVDPQYGYVASCPSNIGTGMRASIHLPLPRLTNLGNDTESLEETAKSMGLSMRAAGGEHTGYGRSGIVDISPRTRIGVSESEIVDLLLDGVGELWAMEQNLAQKRTGFAAKEQTGRVLGTREAMQLAV